MSKYRLFFIILLAMTFSCKPDKKDKENIYSPASVVKAENISFTIVGKIPHDINSFTQGLEFYDGKLYESTGAPTELANTKTTINEINLSNGKSTKIIEQDKSKFFGEGMTFLNGKLYQLTYKNQLAFIYDAKSFKSLGTFKYINSEGWGLTNDGKYIIMSDGSDKIYFLNDTNYKVEKSLSIKLEGSPLINLNELEYINGFIYANVWQTSYIVKIEPSTGNVVGKLDLSSVYFDAKSKQPNCDVLNGIAYDKSSNKVLVTGKLFSDIYEINFNM